MQQFPEFADPVYRQQSIAIAVITESNGVLNLVELPNVKIAAEKLTTHDVSEQVKGNIVAVLPNSGNRGYCRVVLDSKSIEHFT